MTKASFLKKVLPLSLVAALALSLTLLVGCSGGGEDKTIKVAATPSPHAEILNDAVKPILEEQGYTLEVQEFNDYVQPNTATEDGEVDANYFQHQPYLDSFNEEKGTNLVSVATIHYEPMCIYPGKTTDLNALPDGATVAVPNDTTNEARALLLLEQAGLITVDPDAGINATPNDITSNPKNLNIEELEAASIPTMVSDVDLAVINGNFAVGAGLDLTNALATESADSLAAQTYGNVLVVKEDNQDSEKIQALKDALLSDEVRDYINNTYNGAVLPVF